VKLFYQFIKQVGIFRTNECLPFGHDWMTHTHTYIVWDINQQRLKLCSDILENWNSPPWTNSK